MSRSSASIIALKQYTQSQVSMDEQEEIDVELFSGSDRACALLNGALVERAVEYSLETKMRKDMSNGAKAEIFGMDGPVGTFSAKIALGYALEVFGQKVRHDLDVIRHIRNAFAHCRKPIKFDMPVVSAVCATLILPMIEEIRMVPLVMRNPGKLKKWPDDWQYSPRALYEIGCNTIGENLHTVYRTDEGHDMSLLP